MFRDKWHRSCVHLLVNLSDCFPDTTCRMFYFKEMLIFNKEDISSSFVSLHRLLTCSFRIFSNIIFNYMDLLYLTYLRSCLICNSFTDLFSEFKVVFSFVWYLFSCNVPIIISLYHNDTTPFYLPIFLHVQTMTVACDCYFLEHELLVWEN